LISSEGVDPAAAESSRHSGKRREGSQAATARECPYADLAGAGNFAGTVFPVVALPVTTYFRAVLGELVRDHLGQKSDVAFPGFRMAAPLGLVRA
jgi:hypothetical protein